MVKGGIGEGRLSYTASKKLPMFMRVCVFSSFSPGTGEKVPQADEGAAFEQEREPLIGALAPFLSLVVRR